RSIPRHSRRHRPLERPALEALAKLRLPAEPWTTRAAEAATKDGVAQVRSAIEILARPRDRVSLDRSVPYDGACDAQARPGPGRLARTEETPQPSQLEAGET